MFHVELRQFPHVSRAFNLSGEEVQRRFVGPWAAGMMIEHDGRRWPPERTRLTVLEGPSLGPEQLGMGRGWATAGKRSADVTDALLGEARRRAGSPPELESLKLAIGERVAGADPGPVSLTDVLALAAAGRPGHRASEQLALAEQAVWELLHQDRLQLTADGALVPRGRWQPALLEFAAWAGTGSVRYGVTGAPAPASAPEPDPPH